MSLHLPRPGPVATSLFITVFMWNTFIPIRYKFFPQRFCNDISDYIYIPSDTDKGTYIASIRTMQHDRLYNVRDGLDFPADLFWRAKIQF